MKWILSLKHWQVFLLLSLATFLNNLTVVNSRLWTVILSSTGGMMYFLFWLLVGHQLYQLLPDKIQLNYNFFIINAFIWLSSYAAAFIIADEQGMSFTGILGFLFLYVFFAFLHFLFFPVKVLKSIEMNREASVGECLGDFFLLIFFPIGIWFLQPRINKAAAASQGAK